MLGALVALTLSCAPGDGEVVLACTTSVEDTGLLDALLPAFRKAHPGHAVKVLAVGSGEARSLGQRGDADIVIAHSPEAEARFMAAGAGRRRTALMTNDFVIVGPPDDPARIRGRYLMPAMRVLATAGEPFVSRGDDSGTHARELSLWKLAGVAPDTAGGWYMPVGQGQAEALRIASERQAYTLTDRATFRALYDRLELDVMVEGEEPLENVYSVITTTAGRNYEGADALARWLVGEQARSMIAEFGRERFGASLFQPRTTGS